MTEQNKLKPLDLSKTTFEANGKTYHITQNLCIERWRHFEDLQALVGVGRSFDDIFKAFRDIWDALDDKGGAKVATASIICHNAMTGIKTKLEERTHPALMICTLFCNFEGENEKIYDEEVMKSKIEDWQQEGYKVDDFFQLAWNLVPGFIDVYRQSTPDISSHTKKRKPSGSKSKS
jgi:hypothetical protein